VTERERERESGERSRAGDEQPQQVGWRIPYSVAIFLAPAKKARIRNMMMNILKRATHTHMQGRRAERELPTRRTHALYKHAASVSPSLTG